MMRPMLSRTTADATRVMAMAKTAKGRSCPVKTAVCGKNPGPMADVAMGNAAQKNVQRTRFVALSHTERLAGFEMV